MATRCTVEDELNCMVEELHSELNDPEFLADSFDFGYIAGMEVALGLVMSRLEDVINT